jgi:hypothetical protein
MSTRKIKITHDGGLSVVKGTRVLDAETGEDLQWVRRVEIVFDAGHGAPEAILYVTAPELEITTEVEIRENERAQEECIADAVVVRLKNFIIRQFSPRLTQ